MFDVYEGEGIRMLEVAGLQTALRGLMVSDYVDEHNGYFVLTLMSMMSLNPDFPPSPR